MRSRDLFLEDPEWGVSQGEVHGRTFIRHVNEWDYFSNGVRLMDDLLDKLIDENIENIVIVKDNKRYMSSIEDWQEYGRTGVLAGLDDSEYYTLLPLHYMTEV